MQIRGKLIGHRIKYWRQDLREVEDSQYVLSRSTKNEALIIGLQPNTYYYVRVMAYNSAGNKIISFKTLQCPKCLFLCHYPQMPQMEI